MHTHEIHRVCPHIHYRPYPLTDNFCFLCGVPSYCWTCLSLKYLNYHESSTVVQCMSIWILIDSLSLSLPAGPLFVLGIYSYHFCPLLLVPYRIVMFLYMYNYIVYIYIYTYTDMYIYIYTYIQIQFWILHMPIFLDEHVLPCIYIYKYQFVLCPFSFEYLHLLIPTLLGSSALQLEGGSKQTAEKRQEAYFQDRWVVEKNGDDMFLKEPYPGSKLTWLWKTHCFPLGIWSTFMVGVWHFYVCLQEVNYGFTDIYGGFLNPNFLDQFSIESHGFGDPPF